MFCASRAFPTLFICLLATQASIVHSRSPTKPLAPTHKVSAFSVPYIDCKGSSSDPSIGQVVAGGRLINVCDASKQSENQLINREAVTKATMGLLAPTASYKYLKYARDVEASNLTDTLKLFHVPERHLDAFTQPTLRALKSKVIQRGFIFGGIAGAGMGVAQFINVPKLRSKSEERLSNLPNTNFPTTISAPKNSKSAVPAERPLNIDGAKP